MAFNSGSASFATINNLEPRRLLAGHSLDVGWGDAGFQSLAGPAYLSIPSANGKTMVVQRNSDYTGIRLVRLNSDGSTDTSFGTNGVGPLMSFNFVDVFSATTQPDGKIVVTGGDILFVARFNADGTIDNSFGTNGIAKPTEVVQGTQPTFPLGGLALQSDGKIITAGYISMQLQDHNAQFAALYRFNTDGTLDSTFGDAGRVVMSVENVHPQVLATLSDDRIFLATVNGNLAQYTKDGAPDLSFSQDGLTNIDTLMGYEDFRTAIQLDDGKMLIGGSSYEVAGMPGSTWTSGLPIIMRLNADGSVDTTFGEEGTFKNHLGGGSPGWTENFTAMTVDSDGRIFASGTPLTAKKFTLYALTPQGELDTSYMTGGILSSSTEFYANAIVIQDDGKLLISGTGANKTGLVVRVAVEPPASLGANGTLYLRGTEADDTISAEPDGTKISVNINGTVTEFTAADVNDFDVDGFAGNDVITISVGLNAIVRPGAGNDSVTTSIGNDKITEDDTNSGKDTIRSSDGNDTINSGEGNDRVIAGSGKMVINTWFGDDIVTVGDGQMKIDLGLGNDTITTGWCQQSTIQGNWGNDTITTYGTVYIDAGPGYRAAAANKVLTDDDTVTATGGRIRVDLDGGNNTCTISSRIDCVVGGGLGNDLIITGSGNDHIDPIGGNDTVYSNGGNDLIRQLGDTDLIDAGSGNDVIDSGTRGLSVNPTIYGGGGNDSIYAGRGGVVYGGSGNDGISAQRPPGNVPVDMTFSLEAHGQGGNDTIIGSDGRDKLYGGEGDDWLRGGMSSDKLFGGAGNDKLSGNGGNDILLGDIGNDTFFGNAGDDKLYANDSEADTVNGGEGSDQYDADDLDVVTDAETPIV